MALAAAGSLGTVSRADATFYYWQDSEPSLYQSYRSEPAIQPRRPHGRHPAAKKDTPPEKDTSAKPQAPLTIAISINRQQVKIYDANGFFAQAPVSTGMRGHPTPMGVFSVIQKHKWHHSNIYSGAPMPYMQRITWSGVAMHAGVLPGYPASHGCIRMPNAFAIKMWNWTRLGARVLVTPGEIAPESFSHPLLPTVKTQPQPPDAADAGSKAPAAKADKGAPTGQPQSSEAKLDLRPSVGQASDKTLTADASGPARASEGPVTMSDAPSAPKDGVAADQAGAERAAKSETITLETVDAAPKPDDKGSNPGMPTESKAPEIVKVEAEIDPGKPITAAPGENAKSTADANKDETRPPDAAKAAAAKAEAAKRTGQISVFVSRKDSKVYVRQNFAPLFDSPVTVTPSDRPLGTHVFTALVDKNDPNILRWTVVSLPVSLRSQAREDAPVRRKGAHAAHIEAKPVPVADSPAEALDRITIPNDVMARITEALTTGSSIIVSDQGINQGETGEGTDFIVSLR